MSERGHEPLHAWLQHILQNVAGGDSGGAEQSGGKNNISYIKPSKAKSKCMHRKSVHTANTLRAPPPDDTLEFRYCRLFTIFVSQQNTNTHQTHLLEEGANAVADASRAARIKVCFIILFFESQ
jgi:hypothetical protein